MVLRLIDIWLLVAIVAALLLASSPPVPSIIILFVAGLGLTLSAIGAARSRRERLEAIFREAQGLASGSATAGAPPAGRNDAPRDEFSPLRSALADLARRIDAQLKDVARKSRNLEALIDAIEEPVLATDNADAVLLCNRAADALFATAPGSGSIRGRPVREVLTQAAILELLSAAKAGQTRRDKVRVTTPLGVRTFQASASPVPAAWGQGIFGAVLVMRDVTEMDHAAQVKTDFVANASHELRTPIAAIRAAAETLQAAVADDPAMAVRSADMIVAHSARLEEMVRDLLDLSRLETPDLPLRTEPINPADLGAAIAPLFEESCREKSLTISREFDPALNGMRSDRNLLTLILRNLVENAVKFAYEGSEVRIVGRPAPGQPGMARFEVIDKGIGVPLNLQERVFERYFQVEPARQGMTGTRGTGLGLAIVKHAAKSLGGRCGLTSVWREGTTAWVEVPVG